MPKRERKDSETEVFVMLKRGDKVYDELGGLVALRYFCKISRFLTGDRC